MTVAPGALALPPAPELQPDALTAAHQIAVIARTNLGRAERPFGVNKSVVFIWRPLRYSTARNCALGPSGNERPFHYPDRPGLGRSRRGMTGNWRPALPFDDESYAYTPRPLQSVQGRLLNPPANRRRRRPSTPSSQKSSAGIFHIRAANRLSKRERQLGTGPHVAIR